jgi:hypothetical protein
MNETTLLEELLKEAERRLTRMRNNVNGHEHWLSMHTPSVPMSSNHEEAQTYILLKILKRLESIDSSLLVIMGNQRGES